MIARVKPADGMQETTQRARVVVTDLLAELEAIAANGMALEALGDVIANPAAHAGQAEAVIQESYRQAISLPSRCEAARNIAEALQALVNIERRGKG